MINRLLIFVISGSLVGLFFADLGQKKETYSSEIIIPVPEVFPDESGLRFIENKGQWDEKFRYNVRLRGGNILMGSECLTYSFYEYPEKRHPAVNLSAFGSKLLTAKEKEAQLIHGHVVKLWFEGANKDPEILPSHRFYEYHNYFLDNDSSRWAEKVGLYGQLRYKNLWDKTDLYIYGKDENVKYDLILAPHADPSLIRLRYEGADKVYLKNGALHIKTTVRTITEDPPIVYQEIDGERVMVKCNFVLNGSELSFSFPKGYDKNQALVIDPTLIFSTYTGSRDDNWGFTATYGNNGNFYGGGIVFGARVGASGYPTTPGAFQRSYRGGDSDAAISKFDSAGTRLMYSTYLGGVEEDQPQSMFVNANGELYIYGRTNSNNFPTSTSAYDRIYNGGFDIFIFKVNTTGGMVASTYLGGPGSDGENGDANIGGTGNPPVLKFNYGDDSRGEIILDASSNVYLAACTKSRGFPTTAGAIRRSLSGGQDGVVLKMTPNLNSLTWSTYLGGSNLDAAYGIKLASNGDVFVTGGTNSNGGFGMPAGGLHQNYQGGIADGYIVKLNANGTRILNGTYIGTSSYDQSYFIELDEREKVYITGQTLGNYPILASAGSIYSNAGAAQFITKLENDLSAMIYSTRFGSSNARTVNISPTAFLVDRCDNVYVTGWGGSTNQSRGASYGADNNLIGFTRNMPLTADAIRTNTDGSDFYIIVLDRDARSLLYGTYMGGNNNGGSGEHVDGGTCRFDKEGVIYHGVCANCGGLRSTFPTTPGVVSNTNNSPNCNFAGFKIDLELSGVEAAFRPLDRQNQPLQFKGCAPLFVNFDNRSNGAGGSTYIWDFGDGSPQDLNFEPAHIYTSPGTYTVRLILIDSTSCNIFDTTYAEIIAFAPPIALAGPDEIICEGDSVPLTASGAGNNGNYRWSPNANIIDPNNATTTVFPTNDQQYIVLVTDSNGCKARDTVSVTIDRSLQVSVRPDTVLCKGASLTLWGTTNGINYNWTPASTVTNPNQLRSRATPDSTTTYVLHTISARGCELEDSIRAEIYEVFTLGDTSICFMDTIRMATRNGITFSWTPPYNMDDPNIASPLIWPRVDTTYTISARSSEGCISVKDVLVTVDPLPIADAGRSDTICFGDTAQIFASGAFRYVWTPGEFLSDPLRDSTLAFPPITTFYTVTVTDTNGCKDKDQTFVLVNQLPLIDAGRSDTICETDSIRLQATGAATYVWDANPDLSALDISNPWAKPTGGATYYVTGTDINGCVNHDSIFMDVTFLPTVDIDGENFLCVGGAIELTAIGAQQVLWSTGEDTMTIDVYPNGPTTYYVTAILGKCIGETDSITVDRFFEYPVADFEAVPDSGWAPHAVQFTNLSQGAVSYFWSFGYSARTTSIEFEPEFKYPNAGEYDAMLIATSHTGCKDTAWRHILIENLALHVPTAFTPNGDGSNDYFYVGYYGIATLRVRIFSRWGKKVYEANNKDFRWNGIYSGKDVPEGVYVWIIDAIGENGIRLDRKGTVTVFR